MLRRIPKTPYRAAKDKELDWDGFRGGWNNFLKQTELKDEELATAQNLLLTGLGIPTKRWGTENYFLSSATGYGRGLISAKSKSGTIELLSITDEGILTKKSGASYTKITGTSWASGYNLEGRQIDNKVYMVNGQRELVKYDFSSLTGFPTLAIPTGLTPSNVSGATGTTTYSYRITATSQAGETLGSAALSFASLPQILPDTIIYLAWDAVSAASGDLTGYNIYRGDPGDETYLGGVGSDTTGFSDFGIPASMLRTLPLSDSTGGPIAKYIVRYQDRLIVAGIPGEPTKVMISGRVPMQERFNWTAGGGYVLVAPDEGEEITGLSVHQGKIIVTKERSIYQVTLSTFTVGGFALLEPKYELITAAQGCSSHRSIAAVDNDLLFVNSQGVFVLGFEPNILNTLRTNEISAKIRPFFDTVSSDDIKNCTATFFDKKYILSFPSAKKTIIFDRERIAFMGPWITPFGINKAIEHEDDSGIERLVVADANDNYITNFNTALKDDKGTTFRTVLKTKKEDFGAWELFKTIKDVFLNFRSVLGSVDVNILLEERSGQTVTSKSFSIVSQTGKSGWGIDQWGLSQWGLSTADAEASSEDLLRRTYLAKTARTYQVEVTTSGRQDSYELLGIRTLVQPHSIGGTPHEWNIS